MKPLYHFIVEPKDGELYRNKSSGLTLSTSYENHKFTQRIAVVIEVPLKYKGTINKGDYVIVHHNVFRKSFDMKGQLSNSSDFMNSNEYLVEEGKIYMTSKDGINWNPAYPFLFVSPIKNDDTLISAAPFKKEHGKVEYSSHPSVKKNDIVRFTPDSEYEFIVNGQLMYRMKQSDLVWKVL